MNDQELLNRITTNRKIFGGKPIIRGHRIAVEQILGMLAAGDTYETIKEGYPSLEPEDIQACLLYAQSLVQKVRPGLKVAELAEFIPEILKQVPYLTLLVLFGSRARGDAHPDSDWDFAILCDEEQRKQYEKGGWDSFRLGGILQNAYDLLDDQIDVIEMKKCSEILAHYIAKDGMIIYERDPGTFEAFKRKNLKNKDELQAYHQRVQKETNHKLQNLGQ